MAFLGGVVDDGSRSKKMSEFFQYLIAVSFDQLSSGKTGNVLPYHEMS